MVAQIATQQQVNLPLIQDSPEIHDWKWSEK